jgi:hypothetical protein
MAQRRPRSHTLIGRRALRLHRCAQSLLSIAVVAVLAACGGNERSAATPTPRPGSEGRPIGAQPGPGDEAITTSMRFVRGYLAFQAGQLEPDRVPDVTPQLREALERLRVPPASQDRPTKVVGVELERIDARSARVTVHVRNLDEQLTYPLPLDLIRRDSRWAVQSAGDDT